MTASPGTDLEALLQARLHDPFRYLGLHRVGARWVLRVFQPHADAILLHLHAGLEPLERVHPAGLFEWHGDEQPLTPHLLSVSEGGQVRDTHDPYAFAPALSGHDLYLFNEGRLRQAGRTLGSHVEERNGVRGVRFAVWAPNAERASVVGDFNRWDGRVHPMGVHGSSGVWELFVPGLSGCELYKF
ncbi:MAG TPA: 1,4-alpha-glucan branching enzyme, partial [Burkholderiales bacterium]|nr:1,4-alpha-glucan branching enzyme [Burkholderiales bacterium]